MASNKATFPYESCLFGKPSFSLQDIEMLLRPSPPRGQPYSMHDRLEVVGELEGIQPWDVPGFVIAKIGDESVILPDELETKLKDLIRHRISVLQIDDRHYIRKLG
jgi:hypothetical protein